MCNMSMCFPPCLCHLQNPLEIPAVGIQQFVGNMSSAEDVQLSVVCPQLGGGEVDGVLCLWYC